MLKQSNTDRRIPAETPMLRPNPHLWQIAAIRDLMLLVLSGIVLWALYSLQVVFLPVFIALGLAYLFNPLITSMQRRWHVPRSVTITLLLIVLAFAITGLMTWLGPLLMAQVKALANKAPQYIQSITQRYGIEVGNITNQLTLLATHLGEDPMGVLQSVFLGTGQAFGLIGVVVGTTTAVVLSTVLVPIYFFFFAWYFEQMTMQVSHFLPTSHKPRIIHILHQMDRAISGFFRGRLLVALISGILYAIGWAATGVPYWFLLGVGTGLITVIPYMSVIGWPLAVLLKYLDAITSSGPSVVWWLPIVVWPSVAYLVVQLIESWLLTPLIQSQSTDMSAVTVLIVVFVGGALGGVVGLLLAVPVAACVKILLTELFIPLLEQWAAHH